MMKFIKKYGLAILVLLLFFIFSVYFLLLTSSHKSNIESNKCNVAGIKVRGDLVNYIPKSDLSPTNGQLNVDETASEDIYQAIKTANEDPNIKVVLLDIDSRGGSGVAAKEIESTLKSLGKPRVAFIREYAESGAYWLSTGASIIFASDISSIGKIGVNASYLDVIQRNIQDGYTYHSITTGKYKDLGDPNKPITKEDENLLKSHISFAYNDFIKTVSQNRNIKEDKVKSIADGSSFYGGEALKLGLIDRLGNMDDVTKYIETSYLNNKANVCWLLK